MTIYLTMSKLYCNKLLSLIFTLCYCSKDGRSLLKFYIFFPLTIHLRPPPPITHIHVHTHTPSLPFPPSLSSRKPLPFPLLVLLLTSENKSEKLLSKTKVMIGINDVYCGLYVHVAIATSLLKLCDGLRDDQLPELGILLEDREGETVVKFVGKEAGRREKENAKRVCTSD